MLFPSLPRSRPRRKLMHVCDAGESCIQFACRHCGHKTDWLTWDNRVSEAKRGVPCPKCNPTLLGTASAAVDERGTR